MIISQFVFSRKRGRGVVKSGSPVAEFRKTWKAACIKADKPDALFHDFRRTAIKNMVCAGVPRKVAMLISGHKTESIFERYNITNDNDLEKAVRKTQAYVEQLPKKRERVARISSGKKRAGRSK